MLLVASTNGLVGFPAAIEILQGGGSALDAVEADGHHCGVTTQPDRTYVAWDGAGEPETLPRILVSGRQAGSR